jgi:DNA-binding CsgD family transcriptional regulator
MSLVLTTADARRLTAALQVLSAPLDAPTSEQWVRTVQKQLRELFSADHAIFVAAGPGGPTVLAEGYRAEVSEEAAAILVAPDRFNVAFDAHMRATGNEVFQDERMLRAIGVERRAAERSACWEVREPLGMCRTLGLYTHSLELPRVLYVTYERKYSAPGEDECGLVLMNLLLPAFKAGLRSLERLAAHRHALARVLDAVRDAALVYDCAGREVARNRACVGLLEKDPEARVVACEAERMARGLAALRYPTQQAGSADTFPSAERTVRTGCGDYRLSGTCVGGDSWAGGPDAAVVVTVEALRKDLPSPAVLRSRHGLTAREADVARLLAAGLTDRQVAATLFISHSTARHHAERILAKLGLTSRSGLVLRLLQAS